MSLMRYARNHVNALAATCSWDLRTMGLKLAATGRNSHPLPAHRLFASMSAQLCLLVLRPTQFVDQLADS